MLKLIRRLLSFLFRRAEPVEPEWWSGVDEIARQGWPWK